MQRRQKCTTKSRSSAASDVYKRKPIYLPAMKKKFNFEDLWNQDSRPLIMDYQSPGQRSRSPPTHYFKSAQSSARGLYDSKSKHYHTQIERIIGPLKDSSKPQNKFTSSVQDITDFNETYLSMSPERT